MKLKNFFITLAALAASAFNLYAGNANTDWRGRILDETGEPVPYATIALISKADSTIISGTTADLDGVFTVGSEINDAIIMVEMLGYETCYVVPADDMVIRLVPSTEILGEALVTAVMPKTKLTGEGLQTSVRGSVLEHIGTANDALERVPGLIKGKDGLEVIGKGAPVIYINGRKVTDKSELDRLQSTDIQSIEVINNPGAQYDATIRSVVRIKTVRRQGEGFGFNLGATDEQSLRKAEANDYTGDVSFNYRHNDLDVFAGANIFKFTSRQTSYLYQETLGTPSFRQEGDLLADYLQKNYYFNGGLNWMINDRHSTGFKMDYGRLYDVNTHQILREDIFGNGELIDRLTAEGDYVNGDRAPRTLSANTYYNGTAGKLNIDFNADLYNAVNSETSITEEGSEFAEDAVVKNSTLMENRLLATKLVLSYPIWQGQLQAGTEETFSRRSDEYTIAGAALAPSSSKVNEDNIASFVNYAFVLPKVGQFSAGLRYEHVNYVYEDLLGSENFSKKYNNIFPSLSFAGQFGKVQTMINYSVKTQRPNFSMLSNAIHYNSRFVLQTGNAALQPQIDKSLGITAMWKCVTLITSYDHIDNTMTIWSEKYNDEGVILLRNVNLEKPWRVMGAFINATPTVGIWSLNCTAGVQQQWLSIDSKEGTYTRELKFNDKPMWILQCFNTFRTKNGWQFELGGELHSRGYSQSTLVTNVYFDLTAAVQKALLKDGSLVLRLSGSDLAGLADTNVYADYGSHIIRQTNQMDNCRVKMSLRYSFNSAASKYKGTGAGQDAKSRM